MDSANNASYMLISVNFCDGWGCRCEPLLQAGRRGLEHRLDRLRQGAGRLLAELDGDPSGGAELGGEEVDVERVAERRVHRVIQVDAAVGHLDPASRPLGAAAELDLLGQVGTHVRVLPPARQTTGLGPARRLGGSAAPSGPPEIIPLESLALRTDPPPRPRGKRLTASGVPDPRAFNVPPVRFSITRKGGNGAYKGRALGGARGYRYRAGGNGVQQRPGNGETCGFSHA